MEGQSIFTLLTSKLGGLTSTEIILLFIGFIVVAFSVLSLITNTYVSQKAKSHINELITTASKTGTIYNTDNDIDKIVYSFNKLIKQKPKLDRDTIDSITIYNDKDIPNSGISIVFEDINGDPIILDSNLLSSIADSLNSLPLISNTSYDETSGEIVLNGGAPSSSSGGSNNNPNGPTSPTIVWNSSGNETTPGSTGTLTFTNASDNQTYTYNVKVMDMGNNTTAIWTSEFMRHPIPTTGGINLTGEIISSANWSNGAYEIHDYRGCIDDDTDCGINFLGKTNMPGYNLERGNSKVGLYTWQARMGTTEPDCDQNGDCEEDIDNSVCSQLGNGWKLPSDSNYTNLEIQLNTLSDVDWTNTWSYRGNHGWMGNKFGGLVTSLPGDRISSGVFNAGGSFLHLWSATHYSDTSLFSRPFHSTLDSVYRYAHDQIHGFRILCFKDS